MLSSPWTTWHVGDLIERRSLQLGQQGADLLLGNAIEDSFHASQSPCSRFQHVEDLLFLLDIAHQVRLVA